MIHCTNMDEKASQPHIAVFVETAAAKPHCSPPLAVELERSVSLSALTCRLNAGCFSISLSLCSQALLWKTLGDEVPDDAHAFRRILSMLPSTAFALLWSLALFILATRSLLYVLRCFCRFDMVKAEFLNCEGVNYLFAPWISWLLLLQSSPFIAPKTIYYHVLWWVFVVPLLVLDVKIYGQWFTKGKRFLSTVANPTSQLSVIGNLVGAQAAAQMGWRESALCMFSLATAHYLVLFVTLYQRLTGGNSSPTMLRPTFFLFFAAPSAASLAWNSISGTFDTPAKLLFLLSLFLFFSLVCRPTLFKKSARKFNVAWWAYCYPLTVLALASAAYAQQVKGNIAHWMMLLISALSVLVSLGLLVLTAFNTNMLLLPTAAQDNDPSLSFNCCCTSK